MHLRTACLLKNTMMTMIYLLFFFYETQKTSTRVSSQVWSNFVLSLVAVLNRTHLTLNSECSTKNKRICSRKLLLDTSFLSFFNVYLDSFLLFVYKIVSFIIVTTYVLYETGSIVTLSKQERWRKNCRILCEFLEKFILNKNINKKHGETKYRYVAIVEFFDR